MAASVTCTGFDVAANGSIRVRFGKREYEFESKAHMRQYLKDFDVEAFLDKVAMVRMIRRQPGLASPNVFVGKSITVDFSVANWGGSN